MWTDRQTVDKVSHNGSGKRLVKNLNENTFNVVYLKAYFVEKYISLLFFFFFLRNSCKIIGPTNCKKINMVIVKGHDFYIIQPQSDTVFRYCDNKTRNLNLKG